MRYHYSLIPEDEPIIRDMPVYLSSTANSGTFLQLGATDPDNNADQGISLIPTFSTSISSTMCVDTFGILSDTSYTSVTAGNVYAAATNGANYGKVIINPFAVYLAQYIDDATGRFACDTNTSTVLNVASLEDDIDGGWIVLTDASSASNKNSIRHITAASTNNATLDSTFSADISSSDYFLKVLPVNHRYVSVDKNSVGLASFTGDTPVTGASTRIMVAENYIQSDSISFQPLRKASHKAKNGLTGIKVFADIIQLDHAYNVLS